TGTSSTSASTSERQLVFRRCRRPAGVGLLAVREVRLRGPPGQGLASAKTELPLLTGHVGDGGARRRSGGSGVPAILDALGRRGDAMGIEGRRRPSISGAL